MKPKKEKLCVFLIFQNAPHIFEINRKVRDLILIIGFFVSIHGFIFAQNQALETPSSTPAQGASSQPGGGSSEEVENGTTETDVPQAAAPVMEIKRLETPEPLYSFELRNAEIIALFRTLAHDYKLNLFIDKGVQGMITASLSNVSLEKFLDIVAESQNLTLEKKGDIITVKPNLVVKTFVLNYVEAKKLLETATSVSVQAASAGATTAAGSESTPQQVNTIYDLISHQGKILLGTQLNSIVVIDYPVNLKKIEEYLAVMDKKMGSRVFKLKYLKADDVVGQTSTKTETVATSEGSVTTTTATTGTSSSSATGS
ncbi:MAG: hypothetical protein V2A64_01660 [Candidatus Omnitrophota bacterium]